MNSFTVFFFLRKKAALLKTPGHYFQRVLRNQVDFLGIFFLWVEIQLKDDSFLHIDKVKHIKTKVSK